jgi:hypothetical protein
MQPPLLAALDAEAATMAAAAAADSAAAAAADAVPLGVNLSDIDEAAEAAAVEAAEAEAAAAAAQAAAAEDTPDTGAAGDQWCAAVALAAGGCGACLLGSVCMLLQQPTHLLTPASVLCVHRFAHEGILNCARAIREDLEHLGLLDRLLLGTPPTAPPADAAAAAAAGDVSAVHAQGCAAAAQAGGAAHLCSGQGGGQGLAAAGTGSGSGGKAPAASASAEAAAADGRWLRTADLPDCRGWTLVLTGHSLGECLCCGAATKAGCGVACSLSAALLQAIPAPTPMMHKGRCSGANLTA